MLISIVENSVLWSAAFVGVVTIILMALLARPIRTPEPLAHIHEGALMIDQTGKPDYSRFQARDGTFLAYRLYPAKNGVGDQIAILAHGSSALSDEMNAVARALAEAGIVAVAIDARGHGASGSRGDVGYIGQLDDDLADLVSELRKSYPRAKLMMIGHSSGGGYALRIATKPVGALFDHFLLLAPYLGHRAPTNPPTSDTTRWASPDVPRIIAIKILQQIGVDWPQSLPVIAFANAPEAGNAVTRRYSFRLLENYGPPEDWKSATQTAAARAEIIVGAKDTLMDVKAYQNAIAPLGMRVTILPDVDHMGMVYQSAALAAIVAATKPPSIETIAA
jgi:alpha-beta hydrolase superfamily lysophospholipase